MSDSESAAGHIRALLLDYAIEHITTDYIQFTEQAVSDLWRQYLHPILAVDPNSLILPPDPFDTLTRVYALPSLAPFQEKFHSTPNAVQYIKKVLAQNPKKPPSTTAALEEHPPETHVPLYRPISPVLSARARRETPRLGAKLFSESLPTSHARFLRAQAIDPVGIDSVVEEHVKQDDVLDVAWRLRQDQREGVRARLLGVLTQTKEYKNRHLDFVSRPESPPLRNRDYEPHFLPIFPRRRRVGSGVREGDPPPSGLRDIQSLPGVILPRVKVEEIEPELHSQHMVVINGWNAVQSSPSPTPSPQSSHEDQIDQLWSSPDTTPPPPIRPTKMDVIQIPRVKRIGGQRTKPDPIGSASSLGSFLAPHIKVPPAVTRLSPDACDSMIGSAGSTGDATEKDEFDLAINELYGQRQEPGDWILKEKVDEERQLLMEVPILAPPNNHAPNALFLPTHFRDLVAPSKSQAQQLPKHVYQFLKKAKGMASFYVELSWLPIPAKTRRPTHAEILTVEALIDESMPALPVQALLDNSFAPDAFGGDTWCSRYSKCCFEETSPSLNLDVGRCEIVLARKERRRAAGLFDDLKDTEILSDPLVEEDRTTKRPRLEDFDDSGIAFDFPDPDLQSPLSSLAADAAVCPSMLLDGQGGHSVEYGANFSSMPSQQHERYDNGEFLALSFGSAQPTQPLHDAHSDETYASMFEPHHSALVNDTATSTPLPEIATHSLGIFEFAKLRAKKITVPPALLPETAQVHVPIESPANLLPDDMYDRNTVSLPSTWDPPRSQHRYMVSMDVVQRQGLVRSLRSQACCVDLVERESLVSVDVVLDPHSAIVFSNLLTLPSECVDLVQRIAEESWRYSRLFVVLNAYPAAYAYHSKSGNASRESELFAYTPPVLKALRKFRRDLDILEGSGHKRKECIVQHGFANTVNDAALFVRYFGNFVEANDDSGGAIWGDREWLEDDVPEGETDLAAADGMNLFASFVILCQIGIEEFLELTPEERLAKFAGFVGVERMVLLNEVIERRLAALEPSESDVEMVGSVDGSGMNV
ncbi:hypothetical protein C8F01DRAFT_1133304 [Mycena amicta]|nr:hypothetical protein C8F01DRAFT_1133304 [Mycena amicta]